MRTQILKPPISAGIGFLLILPAAYFLLINFLNEVGWSGPYEVSEPLLLSMGLGDGIGFNINLLIAFGPLLAFLLNATSVIAVDWESSTTDLKINFQILKKWTNWTVMIIAGLCLLILFFYLVGENCR